jgi:hypothetical protein
MDIVEAINMMNRLSSLPEIHSAMDKKVVNTIYEYYFKLYEVEKDDIKYFESGEKDHNYMDISIKRKLEVHNNHWSNHSIFYQPCSLSSDPRHDWSQISEIVVHKNDDDENPLFLFIAKYNTSYGSKLNCSYLLRNINNTLMIEHAFM